MKNYLPSEFTLDRITPILIVYLGPILSTFRRQEINIFLSFAYFSSQRGDISALSDKNVKNFLFTLSKRRMGDEKR